MGSTGRLARSRGQPSSSGGAILCDGDRGAGRSPPCGACGRGWHRAAGWATSAHTRGWTRRGAGGSPECAGFPAHAGIDLRVPWSPYSAVGSPRPGGEPTRDGPQLASSCQLACFPRTSGERVRTRCEPVRARSRAGCRNSRSGSMGSILSNRTHSAAVTRSDPISASRTASRFGFRQPFSDPLGPVLTFDVLNEYGIFWDS